MFIEKHDLLRLKEGQDKIIQFLESKDTFSSSSTFMHLTKSKLHFRTPLVNLIWKLKNPKEVEMFIWSLSYRSLNTTYKLQKTFSYSILSP